MWSLAVHRHQKQSPQKCIFDAKGCQITKVGTKKISSKKSRNFKILSYRNVIYLKRKLRTCTIQIHKQKVQFLKGNHFFLKFLKFSHHSWGRPKIFEVMFFEVFKKKFKKWLYQGLSKVARNKLRKLQQIWSFHLRATGDRLRVRAQCAPPRVR